MCLMEATLGHASDMSSPHVECLMCPMISGRSSAVRHMSNVCLDVVYYV